MTSIALAYWVRSSPTFWVLVVTLVPALICTLLARTLYPQWWQLVAYFWYSIPANAFVYLPHEPAVIYAGAIYNPWIVAVVGGLATIVASIVDYFVVKKVFEFRRVAPVKQTALYRKAVHYFYWRPWPTIIVFAFTPLPFYPIRILAPSSNYPLWKYISANVIGRVPRYYLLALGGSWIPVPPKYLVPIALAVILTMPLWVLWVRWRSRARQLDRQP